jgi:hypothetical protein
MAERIKRKKIYHPVSHERNAASESKLIAKEIESLNAEILATETTIEKAMVLLQRIHNLEVKYYQLSKSHHERKQKIETISLKGLTH